MFYLFTDRLIVERGGQKTELRNDPLDAETFAKFQHFVRLAIDYGLSSEPVPVKGGGREDKNAAEGPDKSAQPKKYQLCFNPLYFSPNAKPSSNSPICGKSTVAPEEHTVSYVGREGEAVKLTILPRSAFAIFQYLGRIVAAGEQGRIRLASREAIDYGPLRDDYLFYITGIDRPLLSSPQLRGDKLLRAGRRRHQHQAHPRPARAADRAQHRHRGHSGDPHGARRPVVSFPGSRNRNPA